MFIDKDSSVIDRETVGSEHDHTSLRLWLLLLTCTMTIENGVKKGLRSDFQTTLPPSPSPSSIQRTTLLEKRGKQGVHLKSVVL